MTYKKPQMVAKSNAKKSYVAGCPTNTSQASTGCDVGVSGTQCEIVRSK